MNFKKFMEDFKGKEINKDKLIKLLEDEFKEIEINTKEEYSLIVELNKNTFQIQYTYNDNGQNIIILDTSDVAQVSRFHNL